MSNWVKWWKDKAFLQIWAVILISMGVSLGIISINADNVWCIIGAIAAPLCGGLVIRKIITKKLDELADKYDKEA